MSESNIITESPTKRILLATKLPKKTSSYAPVSHKAVIETTLEALDKAGLKVSQEMYNSARDGRQGMGFYNIEGAGDNEMQIRLIWHNSYDKSMPLRCALGGNVMVCTNGIVRGDMGAFKRKHTGTVLTEFKKDIGLYIDSAGDLFKQMVKDKERMKDILCTRRTCAELLGRMFIEDAVINATQLGIVKKEMELIELSKTDPTKKPTYDYKAPGTLWEFYNLNTMAMKDEHPQFHLNSHQKLHKFITKEYEKEFA